MARIYRKTLEVYVCWLMCSVYLDLSVTITSVWNTVGSSIPVLQSSQTAFLVGCLGLWAEALVCLDRPTCSAISDPPVSRTSVEVRIEGAHQNLRHLLEVLILGLSIQCNAPYRFREYKVPVFHSLLYLIHRLYLIHSNWTLFFALNHSFLQSFSW